MWHPLTSTNLSINSSRHETARRRQSTTFLSSTVEIRSNELVAYDTKVRRLSIFRVLGGDRRGTSIFCVNFFVLRFSDSSCLLSILSFALCCLSKKVEPRTSVANLESQVLCFYISLFLYPIFFLTRSCKSLWNYNCLLSISASSIMP